MAGADMYDALAHWGPFHMVGKFCGGGGQHPGFKEYAVDSMFEQLNTMRTNKHWFSVGLILPSGVKNFQKFPKMPYSWIIQAKHCVFSPPKNWYYKVCVPWLATLTTIN